MNKDLQQLILAKPIKKLIAELKVNHPELEDLAVEFKNLERQNRMGIISQNDFLEEQIKILESIVNLLDHDEYPPPSPKTIAETKQLLDSNNLLEAFPLLQDHYQEIIVLRKKYEIGLLYQTMKLELQSVWEEQKKNIKSRMIAIIDIT